MRATRLRFMSAESSKARRNILGAVPSLSALNCVFGLHSSGYRGEPLGHRPLDAQMSAAWGTLLTSEPKYTTGRRGIPGHCLEDDAHNGGGPSEEHPVGEARDPSGRAVEDVSVDHRGADVPATVQLLDGTNVVTLRRAVGGRRVLGSMARAGLALRALRTASLTARWRTDSCRWRRRR